MGESAQVWLSVLLGVAALWLLRHGWRGLRGTTLRAPWCWAVLAVCGIIGAEMALGLSGVNEAPHAETLRFAAAVLVFCPTMAVLGGKRPQNAAWQFIVFTLWGVLALPALEIWLRGRGETLEIHAVRSWFLAVLVVAGAVNHLPTRFGLAAVQLATAQAILLWPHLPAGELSGWRPPVWLAMLVLFWSIWTARRTAARPRRHAPADGNVAELRNWSYVWRDFRDWFGTVWSLRVMERMNATAATNGWPVVLEWEGFVRRGDSATAADSEKNAAFEPPAAVEQSLRALLRRFVSAEWIEQRLQEIPENG